MIGTSAYCWVCGGVRDLYDHHRYDDDDDGEQRVLLLLLNVLHYVHGIWYGFL
jgi:hypothetical protein